MRTIFRILLIFAVLGVVSMLMGGTGCNQRVDADLRVSSAGGMGMLAVISTDSTRANSFTRFYTFPVSEEKPELHAAGEFRGQLVGLVPDGEAFLLIYSDGSVFRFRAEGNPVQVLTGGGRRLVNAVRDQGDMIYALAMGESEKPEILAFNPGAADSAPEDWRRQGPPVAMLDTPGMLEMALVQGRPAVFWRSFVRGSMEDGLRGAMLDDNGVWQRLPLAPGTQYSGVFAVTTYNQGVLALQERGRFGSTGQAHSVLFYRPESGWNFMLTPDALREEQTASALTLSASDGNLWFGMLADGGFSIMHSNDPALGGWRVVAGGGEQAGGESNLYFIFLFIMFMIFTSTFFRMLRLKRGGVAVAPVVGAGTLASPVDRAVAMLVDATLVLPLPILYMGNANEALRQVYLGRQVVAYLLFLGGLTLYSFVAEAIYGQTFGKWLFRIKVKSADGGRPRFWQIAVRNTGRFIDFFPVYLAGSMIWYLVALLAVSFTRRRQRVGDLLAATVVQRVIPLAARRVVLASASPRRRELLEEMGVNFNILPADIDETPVAGVHPRQMAERLARQKAEAVLANCPPDVLVVAADTIVVVDDRILGKPADREQARQMLRDLRGRTHLVITGMSIIDKADGRQVDGSDVTEVVMRDFGDEEIELYLQSGEADDKAGAYAIQGRGGDFVSGIRGSLSNVIGLPVEMLSSIFKDMF